MLTRRVLVFFPQCPVPSRSGAHRRCLEIIEGLLELGCTVRLCSTDTMEDGRWNDDGRRRLAEMGVEIGEVWNGCTRWERRWFRWSSRLRRDAHLLDDPAWCPPSLRAMVRREIATFRPDAAIHNYVHWWRLARVYRAAGVPAAIEMHDLVTLNAALRKRLEERWRGGGPPDGEDEPSLRPGFFDAPDIRADPLEFRRLGEFPVVSCISSAERELVDRNCLKSRAALVRMTREAVDVAPPLEGPAILPVGPNPFNRQGLHVLARTILPRVRRVAPDFVVRVTGARLAGSPDCPGLEYVGYVADLRAELARSSFLVSPVFGGTGEQVKVLEALSAGLPVVAMEGRFQENAVRDGVDGFRATDADAFADACVRLWNDPELRRTMGHAALEGVKAERSVDSRRAAIEALLRLLEDVRG